MQFYCALTAWEEEEEEEEGRDGKAKNQLKNGHRCDHQLAKVVTATVNPHNLITINTLLFVLLLSWYWFFHLLVFFLLHGVQGICIICTTQILKLHTVQIIYIKRGRWSEEKNWIKSWEGLLQSKSKRINRWKWRQKESSICEKAHVFSRIYCIHLHEFQLWHFTYSSRSRTSKINIAEKNVHKVYYMVSDREKLGTVFTVAKAKLK